MSPPNNNRSGRKRINGLTHEQRVWLWLRKQTEPSTPRAIRAHFGTTKSAASNVLCCLTRKGCVERTGHAQALRYVATDLRPDDLRGTAAGSLKPLLATQQRQRAEALDRSRQQVRTAPRRRRRDPTPLAQAWPVPLRARESAA